MLLDAAVPIYVNRVYLMEYLHARVFSTGHKNILEDFLYQTLGTTQYIAMCRANALIDLRLSRPHRWLAGKSAELPNWSPIRMNWVLDLVDAAFPKIRDDGSALLDPDWQIFQEVCELQPIFQEYMDFTYNHDALLSPNGRVRHLHYKLALEELINPADDTNRATREKTIEYLQVQAAAALEKMYDERLAIANKLTSQDGPNCFAKQQQAHKELVGCNATNDATAEAVFGAWKLERRRNPGISVRRSSGLAQARISKSLAYANAVRNRKRRLSLAAQTANRKQQSGMFGYFHALPHTEQVALVEMCRAERQKQRLLDRQDWEDGGAPHATFSTAPDKLTAGVGGAHQELRSRSQLFRPIPATWSSVKGGHVKSSAQPLLDATEVGLAKGTDRDACHWSWLG